MNIPVLIFSGNNDRAIISFCRFAIEKNISFFIVANGEEDYILKTSYKKNVVAVRKKNVLTIESVLGFVGDVKRKSSSGNVFILPSTEFLNRFILENSSILTQENVSWGLCPLKLYRKISDKYAFNTLCNSFNISTPQHSNIPLLTYPFVVKPRSYATKNKIVDKPAIIYNLEECDIYLRGKNIEDYYFQEYIEGRSIYLLYYFFKNGQYTVYSQENFIQQCNGASMILSKSSNIHEGEIAISFANMFKEVGFWGLVMVEVKLKNDECYMIEANPRLWGPSQLILDSNMNIFDCFAYDNQLIDDIAYLRYKADTWYFWSGGLFNNLSNQLKVDYYNYNEQNFIRSYNEILESEIYYRKDTFEIFRMENGKK